MWKGCFGSRLCSVPRSAFGYPLGVPHGHDSAFRTPHSALEGLWVRWVEGDCRIMFALELDPAGGEDAVALADIGSHEAVY
jgi:hypothetical protein